MEARFQIVVSCENTSYLAWQAQLLCYSALSRLSNHPIVVVHATGEPLRPEFAALRERGFHVLEAPSFTAHPKAFYPPRNEPGSLISLAKAGCVKAEHILFCESDMLFVKPLVYEEGMAAEHYSYLNYGLYHIQAAARQLGIGVPIATLNENLRIGVPYLVPTSELERIASRWLSILDSFERIEWVDVMYAYGLTTAVEGVPGRITHFVQDNFRPMAFLSGSIIHYCYGDLAWDKRYFMTSDSPLTVHASLPAGGPGTVLEEMMSQLAEARTYFQTAACG